MKKQFLAGMLSLAAICSSSHANTFVNNFIVTAPPDPVPQVDATVFINNGGMAIDLFTLGLDFNVPYATANTLWYTNEGNLSSVTGLRMDYYNQSKSTHNQAGAFFNDAGAVVNCGGTNVMAIFRTNLLVGAPYITFSAWATNIVNRGTVEMGAESLIKWNGKSVDLTGGLLNMEGFESGGYLFTGMFDGYWGAGNNDTLVPTSSFGSSFAYTPSYWVTNRDYSYNQTALALGAAAYQHAIMLDPSNVLNQVVYVQNLDGSISNNVYFSGTYPIVEWVWTATNNVTGVNTKEYLSLLDDMFYVTNIVFITNGVGPASTAFGPTYTPTNFLSFYRGRFVVGLTPATPGLSSGFFPSGKATNEYSAYQAIFEPTSLIVPETANLTYSNLPGRIEVTADQLNLSGSRIASENFLSLRAANDFTTDKWTRMLTYAADFDLAKANGQLTVSNLMSPTCPRLHGLVDMYSVRWTNVVVVPNVSTLTNIYNVLLVNSALSGYSPTILQNLTLHSTNVFISDVLNVVSNLTIDATSVTVTTNDPGSQIPFGQLNLISGNILWTNSFPRLQNLTNWGAISVNNTAFFGGVRYPPFYPTANVEPYENFVNNGTIQTLGAFVWSKNFENHGLFDSGPLSLNIQAANATLRDGVFNAPTPTGDITLQANNLVVSNHVLTAGRRLTLWATNYLSDKGPTSSNRWTTGAGGFTLATRTPVANLLGTTIYDSVPAQSLVSCQWAGTDYGKLPSAYTNNAGLGRLYLDAGENGRFSFRGIGANSALYVDYLELRGAMTNRMSDGSLTGLIIDTAQPIKIYFAQAVINGQSVAEKLDGKNGGALNWVSSYAGMFSSTNMVYPDGSTNRLNLALVTSCNLDSDGDGIVNCNDPTPVLISSVPALVVTLTNQPALASRLSWTSLPNAKNTVFYKTSLASTNWTELTNFVSGSSIGPVIVLDPVTQSSRYYRVRLDAVAP